MTRSDVDRRRSDGMACYERSLGAGGWTATAASERREELHDVATERMGTTVKGHEPDAVPASQGEEMGIAHLTMTYQGRQVVVRHRYVIEQEAVAPGNAEQRQHSSGVLDADRTGQDRRI